MIKVSLARPAAGAEFNRRHCLADVCILDVFVITLRWHQGVFYYEWTKCFQGMFEVDGILMCPWDDTLLMLFI